jgi:endoglucanase
MSRSVWCVTLALAACLAPAHAQSRTIVEEHGQLRVQGNRIVDERGAPVQLRGMSLYWSQWIPKYYNAGTLKWLRDDWKVTVVRAAMAVKPDGYEKNPAVERAKVVAVVDAAIELGIYVIIDYHAHTAHENLPLAREFFADMARRYGDSPNVLYEPYNEPLDVSWAKVLKPYHEAVIDAIRVHDPDNIVIVGTRNWSQQVAEAAANPIRRSNVAYTLHFYANTHGQSLRDNAQKALDSGVALFVTEYGTTDATGDGVVNETATRRWWDFLDRNSISHLNWSVADIRESSAALYPGASPDGGWKPAQIKPSGILVRDELRAKAPNLVEKDSR